MGFYGIFINMTGPLNLNIRGQVLSAEMVLEDSSNGTMYPLVNGYKKLSKITIFNGKTHYFYGHFQWLCDKVPDWKVEMCFSLLTWHGHGVHSGLSVLSTFIG